MPSGAAISNFGVASITDSQFAGNLAQAGSGGIGAFAAIGGGGAILNDAALTVTGSSFRDNQAVGGNNSVSPTHNGHALGGGIMSGTLLALLRRRRSATLTGQPEHVQPQPGPGRQRQSGHGHRRPQSDAPDNGYGGGILVYQGSAAISRPR